MKLQQPHSIPSQPFARAAVSDDGQAPYARSSHPGQRSTGIRGYFG